MKTTEIRKRFLEYFAENGHQIVPSSSLVPGNDATLLFTNAGMVQFKDVFLGDESRDYKRATTSQRCVRAGGKHNDLENVGYTARHHTFFEMLGNFSFGDYFKADAIRYSWELLTVEFGLPPDRLWVTVFEEDDEAEAIWVNEIGMPKERVTRIGAKDNFWQMGDTGPCGPCSEIFYDHGPEVEGGPPGSPDQDGDRYVEIWNLVFMQFNRGSDGHLEPLPKPSVDTGMGLERIAAVLQGVHSNYEIDLFQNLIDATAGVMGVRTSDNKSLRVIADHIRSTAFLIVDGVIPSNEGRGYVLRRIIRRAIRHGYQIGCKEVFMHKLVQPLVEEMGAAFPELVEARVLVERVLKQENEKFNETLDQGLKILDHEISRLEGDTIPGEIVFKLYDTFGFPADLTADVARESGLNIDSDEFESAMNAQRSRARSASQFVQGDQVRIEGISRTPFVGYQSLSHEIEGVALLKDQQPVSRLEPGDTGIIVLIETPFYPESGGQIGDRGKINFPDGVFEVTDTQYLANKVIAHFGQVISGYIVVPQKGTAMVDSNRRGLSANNHSATHLLHAALKTVLGSHVDQKGSLVAPDRLRFDFSHFEPVGPVQLVEIESLVNMNIRANNEVKVDVMSLEEAKAAGAAALFGEKYESQVRVVRMGAFSFELCGGTHVNRTGDIGLFKIISESGVAAGVRRIEAFTGESAEKYINEQLELLDDVAASLKTTRSELSDRARAVLDTQKQQQRQIQSLQTRLATAGTDTNVVRDIQGIKVVAVRQDDADAQAMRIVVDQWRNKLQSGVVLVAGVKNGKVTLIAGVSKDLSNRFPAGELVQEVSVLVGGKGGGRPDLAQGGGANVEGIDNALEAAFKWVEKTAVSN
jgi:alanyl-tRNA synthetase